MMRSSFEIVSSIDSDGRLKTRKPAASNIQLLCAEAASIATGTRRINHHRGLLATRPLEAWNAFHVAKMDRARDPINKHTNAVQNRGRRKGQNIDTIASHATMKPTAARLFPRNHWPVPGKHADASAQSMRRFADTASERIVPINLHARRVVIDVNRRHQLRRKKVKAVALDQFWNADRDTPKYTRLGCTILLTLGIPKSSTAVRVSNTLGQKSRARLPKSSNKQSARPSSR